MQLLVCVLLALSATAYAQFDPSNPVLILVNTTSSSTNGAGQSITSTDLETFGYDNATAGQSGFDVYDTSTSSDPSYQTVLDPCSLTYTETGCSEFADCLSDTSSTVYPNVYQCQCQSGFNDTSVDATSPSTLVQAGTICENIDECSNKTAACGVGGDQCTDTSGSHNCTCLTGYSPNADDTYCNDDDECALGTDNCDANAACTNTEGSFSCTCNTGYSGDGVNCTDIDECAAGTDNCDANADCTNTAGSFTCACSTGYSGDGFNCTDIDECADGTDNCDAVATCSNTAGSYTCACDSGYTGDGTNCTDIDECADGTDSCSADATCSNTVGSYDCTCNSGYSGNGTTCTDIDECADAMLNNCTNNSTCTNNNGGFDCACDAGFIGDGVTVCQEVTPLDYCYRAVLNVTGAATADINDADTETAFNAFLDAYKAADVTFSFASPITFTHETSTDESGHISVVVSACFTNMTQNEDDFTAQMTNLVGTHGVTYGASNFTVEIGDYDECFEAYDECSTDATCANTNGDYTCTCNAEFYDNSTSTRAGVTCIDPYYYTCNGTLSTLTLITSWFDDNRLNVSYIEVNTNCTGTNSTDGENYVFNSCSGDDSSNDTHINTAFNVLTNTDYMTFITGYTVNFTYFCSQEKAQNISLDFNNTADNDSPINANDIFSPLGAITPIDIEITRFKSNFQNQLASGDTIKTGELACLQLDPLNAGNGITIQFKRITTSSPTTNDQLGLLTDFCATDIATNNGIVVDTSLGNGQVCFTMHRPSSGFQLQVDLEVELCAGTSCTTASCSTRRRRRRDSGDERRDESVSTIFQVSPEDTCNRGCGDGSCVLDFGGVQQCVCYDNAYKAAGGYCERKEDQGITLTTEQGNTTLFIIVGLAVGLLFALIILAVFIVLRKKNKEESSGYNNSAYKN